MFINGHRIGMFRDTESPYRRGFLKWLSQYKGRGCVYIWAWAWNNRPDRGRPELEHPTSGWREINFTASSCTLTLHHLPPLPHYLTPNLDKIMCCFGKKNHVQFHVTLLVFLISDINQSLPVSCFYCKKKNRNKSCSPRNISNTSLTPACWVRMSFYTDLIDNY